MGLGSLDCLEDSLEGLGESLGVSEKFRRFRKHRPMQALKGRNTLTMGKAH